jgi:5-methylcytosine-specific restriction endonuclease McrA
MAGVCSVPGCPELRPCPRGHGRSTPRSSRNHYGVPRQARGHGADYDRRRRELLADEPLCYWECGRPATTADYAIPWSQGGTLEDLVPACMRCNAQRGGRMAGALARVR